MLRKSHAIDRLLRERPHLRERRFGLPDIGRRHDGERFNPAVQEIADAIDFYGYGVRDENIVEIPDTDLGSGNPTEFKPFPPAIEAMKESLENDLMYRYPYTEGDDRIRQKLLEYVEKEGFINTTPYNYKDVDEKGLSVHNITFSASTSILFNQIINIISNPGDVVLVTGPNYGLFTIRAERAGAELEKLELTKEDGFLINPDKLAKRIDQINESLQQAYHRRQGYVPRVVAFLNANPNNPTGKVMGKKQYQLLCEIAEVCDKRGVFIIDDLVYRDITYDKDNIAVPIATIPGMFRNTISLFGLSKSYSMAALRAGFVVADEIIIREIINKTFQQMDSAPAIIGTALGGTFNATEQRYKAYDEYFNELRKTYVYKFNLLKAMVSGINSVEPKFKKKVTEKVIETLGFADGCKVLSGIPMVDFPENLEPEAGFFAILDFTKLKGMKYKGNVIRSEQDLLEFFYKTSRTRFLVGQSISWPYEDELVGRVTFAIEDERLIKAILNIHNAILLLEGKEDYTIRKNLYEDQSQMARIKVDGWKNAYDTIIASSYLKTLNYEEQTKRYEASFEEYKDLVFVAVRKDEVLGYACFNPIPNIDQFDSELVSLYIKPTEIGKGIGTALFLETCKELKKTFDKSNMIVWCLSDNENAIKFYKKLGGKIVKTKEAKIGDKYYKEYGFYFQLK